MKQLPILAATFVLVAYAYSQDVPCLNTLVPDPITQKVMSGAKRAYTDVPLVPEPRRSELLLRLGYADSLRVIDERLKVQTIGVCADSVLLLRVQGIEYKIDETFWLVTMRDTLITSTTIVAALQTQCDNTFLRVCNANSDGKLLIQQLNHVFDCAEQEFLRTDTLPSFTVGLDENNLLQEVFLND
jgi:hypothetical protein